MYGSLPALPALLALILPLPQSRPPQAPGRIMTEREVIFPDGPVRLAGTIVLPERGGASPAVVLLGGAERGPRTPYKRRTARSFAERGIAAMIYDSPGSGRSTGKALFQTKADRVREALSAWRFLRAQEGIEASKVGAWGISEGAGIALLAAAREERIAFAIAISGAIAIAPLEVIRYRIERMGYELGLSPAIVCKAQLLAEIQLALIAGRDLLEWPLVRLKMRQWPDEPWEELVALVQRCRAKLSREEKGALQKELGRIMESWIDAPWFRLVVPDPRRYRQLLAADAELLFAFLKRGPFAAGDWFHDRDQMALLPRIKCPLLAIWGDGDQFVPAHRSSTRLEAILSAAGHGDFRIEILPGASHLITRREGEQAFASGYPRIMTDWLATRVHR